MWCGVCECVCVCVCGRGVVCGGGRRAWGRSAALAAGRADPSRRARALPVVRAPAAGGAERVPCARGGFESRFRALGMRTVDCCALFSLSTGCDELTLRLERPEVTSLTVEAMAELLRLRRENVGGGLKSNLARPLAGGGQKFRYNASTSSSPSRERL